jgi:hypothetical protein
LPESLYKWLFPPTGETRHLPSLQVSFGSNDDFFASDQNGKLSSRDANPGVERKAPPKLADVAKGILGASIMRKKAYTVSSPTTVQDPQPVVEERPVSPRMERRRTLLDGQASPRLEGHQAMPTLRESVHARQNSNSDQETLNRRRSILPIGQFTRLESRSEAPKVEQRAVPEQDQALQESDNVARRRSILPIGQFTRLESRSEPPKVEPRNVQEQEQAQPEARLEISRTRGEQPRSISPTKEYEVSQQEQRQEPRPEPSQPTHNRRRSILVGVPPVRPSWPDRRTIFQNKERIQLLGAQQPAPPPKSTYVDACVQTEIVEEESMIVRAPVEPAYLPPQHVVPIGSFSDFFRGSYSLGDGLRLI